MRQINVHFFVRPMEPLFFGEPKSFNAGESHFARSQFPPSPMTFQGMVRSQLLRSAEPPLDLDDWSREEREKREILVGDSDRLPPDWQIEGPLPAIVEDEGGEEILHPWAPAPRFLYRGDGDGGFVRGRFFRSSQRAVNDLRDCRMSVGKEVPLFGPPPGQRKRKPLSGWVDGEILYRALAGGPGPFPETHETAIPPFVVNAERRPGIALDRKSNTGRDGMLYLLELLRFKPSSGFWGGLSGTLDERLGKEPLWHGVGGAGKKARLVAFEKAPPLKSQWRELLSGKHLAGFGGRRGLFWLYLLTPARLEAGERSAGGEALLPGGVRLRRGVLPEGVSLRCAVALTGPPVTLGGMDTARGRSRPNHAYVPPGSAWLIEVETDDDALHQETLQKLNDAHLLGDPEEARFGFGHTLIGIEPDRQGAQSHDG